MNDEAIFTRAMQEQPEDTTLRLVFADSLEERGDLRGELIRLLHTLTQSIKVRGRKRMEERLRSLLASGVQPVGPFWTNTIGMRFAWVPVGTFLMGSPETEEDRGEDETQHQVKLTKGFYLGVHPVTQACWRTVLGYNPSRHQRDDLPVDEVSWEDCQAFVGKLSEREGQAYRLPTEAEWEYACRAGTTTPFYFGKNISTDQANFDGNYPYGKGKKGVNRDKTTPGGSFPANAFGLQDMHGNVWEWCNDWVGEYSQFDAVDPQGPPAGVRRVLRGGSFFDQALLVRSADRLKGGPSEGAYYIGFRAARTSTP